MFYFLRNKKSLVINYFISYFTILIVPIFIGIIRCIISVNTIEEQVKIYNYAMLEQTQMVIDENLKSVQYLGMNVAIDSKVLSLIYSDSNLNSSNIYRMSEISDDIKKKLAVNKFIKDIFVIFKRSDRVINVSGIYKTDMYYEQYCTNLDISYNNWIYEILSIHPQEFVFLQNKGESYEASNLFFMQSLPINKKEGNFATLCIDIDISKIKNTLEQNKEVNNEVNLIIDKNKNTIIFSGNKSLIPICHQNMSYLVNTQKNKYIELDGENYVFSSIKSPINDWVYVSLIPTKSFLSKLSYYKNMSILFMFFGLIIGILLSTVYSKKNTSSIRKISDKLKKTVKCNEVKNTKCELDFIDELTTFIANENSAINKSIEEYMPILRANIFMQLLNGTIPSEDEIINTLDSVNVKIDLKNFAVLIISIKGCYDEALNKEWGLIKFIIKNVAEELGRKIGQVFTLDVEQDQVAMILNFEDNTNEEDIKQLVVNITEIIMDKFLVDLNVGIGNIYSNNLYDINLSYIEAKKALEQCFLKTQAKITYFSELVSLDTKYIYTEDIERQLIYNVKSGNNQKVQILLDNLISKIVDNDKLTFQMACFTYFDIISTIIKLLDSLNIDYMEIFKIEYHPLDILLKCKTIKEMNLMTKKIYENVCLFINETKKNNNMDNNMKNNILTYIDIHYLEADISLSMVAEALNINPTYLSHIFKEFMGENFIDFIRKKKVRKIEELLKNKCLSLDEISVIVGYVNSSVMIRNFKKVNGMTPGQFRLTIPPKIK